MSDSILLRCEVEFSIKISVALDLVMMFKAQSNFNSIFIRNSSGRQKPKGFNSKYHLPVARKG